MAQKTNKVLKQSGIVPYRMNNGTIEVLLITTSSQQDWVVPKGGIAGKMSPHDSAAKEAWEEAGVIGEVNPIEFGSYKYRKNGKIYSVKMYSLSVKMECDRFPEAGKRIKQWVKAKEAVKHVKKPSLRRILKEFAKYESKIDTM
ncbi:NUDIX hydrolase [Brunnivagina elsteri]|uniref:NUDIX hydrolase n=1 Tax=Brunnivagina elsteri CCALA 953 TaxID=987040 RepID=A0A2A2TIS2_9CYAN|nr:NUDIX hydrolase [Calothrix elsteri]PAX54091.1 NUDIX hydrolase [Calothrix elsteri CCALA 953]